MPEASSKVGQNANQAKQYLALPLTMYPCAERPPPKNFTLYHILPLSVVLHKHLVGKEGAVVFSTQFYKEPRSGQTKRLTDTADYI